MSRVALLKAKSKQQPLADMFFLVWMIVGITLLLYMGTWIDEDPNLAIKGIYGGLIFALGFLGTFATVGIRWDNRITPKENQNFLSSVFISMVVIFFVNVLAPALTVTPVTNTLFGILIGISEEMFFRGFLLSVFSVITLNEVLAVTASSLIGTVFHAYVYGLNSTLMIIVFGSFFVLGWIYILSGRRLSVPMTAHALVNLLAFWGGA